MRGTRAYTCRLIELCDEGVLSKERIFDEFMFYLSEAEVEEFCRNGFDGELRELFNEESEDTP